MYFGFFFFFFFASACSFASAVYVELGELKAEGEL
jgi:hypothetical protein